ncbi:hypothetical protein RhiirB3_449921, partial [Rhizophagus irregularis]
MSDIDSVATMNHKQQQISVTNTGYISCNFSGATSYAPSNYEESFVTQSFPMFNSSFYRILYDRRYRQQLRHDCTNNSVVHGHLSAAFCLDDIVCVPFSISSQASLASGSSLKIINRSSYYGPMDNYIVRSLSKEDLQKFYMLLLRLTVSCGWALSWAMETALKEDQIGITLTFDGWVNVKNEQLLGTVLLSSEGKPYVWKAVDISSERENYTAVMDKIEIMLTDLKKKDIT